MIHTDATEHAAAMARTQPVTHASESTRTGETLDDILHWSARRLGRSRPRGSRGGDVLEIPGPATLTLLDPTRNMPLLPGRRANPWVTLAEWPWLLAGRNDIEWLLPYLPKAADFSDDGETWRAGYGPRMRRWEGRASWAGGRWDEDLVEVDQLSKVADLLRKKPDSRRAVVSIWDPAEDWSDATRDIPCSNWLHFYIRSGRLSLTVAMRSNDLIWGFSGVNVTNFTSLQQVIAADLGLPVGTYTHLASSLHVYDRHWPMLRNIEADTSPYRYALRGNGRFDLFERRVSLKRSTELARAAIDYVSGEREDPTGWGGSPVTIGAWMNASGASVYADWAYFMTLHRLYRERETGAEAGAALEMIRRVDWRLLAAGALARRAPDPYAAAVRLGASAIRSEAHLKAWAEALNREEA